jgi:hypothetical protein
MEKTPNINSNKDIRIIIEEQKTRDFLREYEELCKKYNRAFLPILNLIPYDPNDIANNDSSDSANQSDDSNKKESDFRRGKIK